MHACQGGNMDLVKYYSVVCENNVNCWNAGLHGACEGGHIEAVKFMINKGANKVNHGIFPNLIQKGHTDIIDLLASEKLAVYQDHPKYSFPYRNIKTKYFHRDYYCGTPDFMNLTTLYWAIAYSNYSRHALIYSITIKDLVPDLLKLLYF